MNIGIIGAGVVGGATGKVLEKKHKVFYYDRYKTQCSEIECIAQEAEITFICVPTPMKPSGEMDYSAIDHSLHYLREHYERIQRKPRELISVIRSTAVSGVTDSFAEEYPLFRFAFNPEFLREKTAREDMEKTDRIVIGANDPGVSEKMVLMYREVFPEANYICVDTKTAEMIKYAANVMLASQVALANEIYGICKAFGVDYNVVKGALLHDERIGRNIDVPGHDGDFGFGGKCFPKDLRALIYRAREHHYDPYLLQEVWRLNERVRKNKDWFDIPGATTENMNFGQGHSGNT